MTTTTEPIETLEAETPDLAAENAVLRTRVREMAASQALNAALEKAGVAATSLVTKALIADVQFDDADAPVNVAALIAKARGEFPDVFRNDAVNGIDARVASPPPESLTREMLKKMSPAEIAKLEWEQVRAALSA